MKRQTLRLLHYLTRARQVPLCSLEDTAGLFTGGITQLRMRYLWMRENSVKVHELTGEAMQTPSPLSSCVLAVRSCTPQAGTGGSSAGVLIGWREGIQHWHLKVLSWNSWLTNWSVLPTELGLIEQASSSFLVSSSFFYLHFYHGKSKHIGKS